MKNLSILIITLILLGCENKVKFVEIPYKTTSPFFSMDLLNTPLHNYVKKNNIKSFGIRYANKIVEDHYLFDRNGLLISNRMYTLNKAEYIYDGGNLVQINNPGNIFSIEDAKYIRFEYDNDGKVFHAITSIPKSRYNSEVRFFYHKDSTEIITYDSIPNYWLEKTVFIKDTSGRIMKEKQYRFNELWCHIDYSYNKKDSLDAKVWYMKGERIQIDSIGNNGLVVLSITNLDTCRFEYLPNEIKSCWKGNLFIKRY